MWAWYMKNGDIQKTLSAVQAVLVASALTVVGVAVLIYGLYFLYLGNITDALSCIGAGVATLFASVIDRFELLKVFGLEARTRELKKTIDQAEVTLAQLGDVAQLVGGSLLRLFCGAGRWNGDPTLAEKAQLAMDLKRMLEKSGSDQSDIRKVLLPWVYESSLDATRRIIGMLHLPLSLVREGLGGRANDADAALRLSKIESFFRLQTGFAELPSAEKFVDLLESVNFITDELDEPDITIFKMELTKAVAEIRHLAFHQEYRDNEYWEKVSAHYARK